MEVLPQKYELKIYPDAESKKFKGNVSIYTEIRGSANKIVLNAKELEIKSAEIISNGSSQIPKIRLYKEKQELVLELDKPVKKNAIIKIEYIGTHNEELYGFYLSRYKTDGKEEALLTTQFESSDARAAFPCFDNPSMKAVFELTLVIDKELEAISNMPVKSVKVIGDKKEVSFYPTPKMSTYLLYMGVGKFEYLQGNLGKLKIRVATTPGKLKYARIPLQYAKQFVSFYEKYFGIKYPLPKLDLIAIPDFSAGAMENWGAITFREIDLLVDPENTSASSRINAANTIAHELAHQWFGDLVTMKWWDDLWLNESFATYMSSKCVNAVYPEWKVNLNFLIDEVATGMSADQLESTHPINVKVKSPDEIESIFDRISYEKGGSILMMLEDYAGPETFRKGLHRYLKEHAYSNATKFDLWDAIQKEATIEGKKLKVGKVAKAWIEKAGYPIVKFNKAEKGYSMTQERFTLLGKTKKGLWPIPITYLAYTKGKKEVAKILFETKNKLINKKAEWLKLNFGQKGFYRVKYYDEMLTLLGTAYKSKIIDDVEGIGIESDLYNLLVARYIKLDTYLNFINNYMLDTEYPLNMQIANHLSVLNTFTYGMSVNQKVRDTALAYFRNAIKKLGISPKKNEDEPTKMFRARVIASLGFLEDAEIKDFAKRNFENALNDKVDPNIRNSIFFVSAWNGDKEVFEKIKDAYLKETLPEKKIYLLVSLGLFRDKQICQNALAFTLSKDVKLQDSFYIPNELSSNPSGKDLLLPWLKENWLELKKRLSAGTHMLTRYVGALSTQRGYDKIKEIKDFFTSKKNYTPAIKKELRETLERIEINTLFEEWLRNDS